MLKKNDFLRLIYNTGVENTDVVKPLLLPSLGFKINSMSPTLNLSKIGGYPPIIKEDWSFLKEKPFLFLGQISLDQIREKNNLLPQNGILCFFLLVDDIGYRYPDRKGEFKVVYIESPVQNVINEEVVTIKERSISFFEYYTFPSYQESILQHINLNEEDLNIIVDIIQEIQYSITGSFDILHQVLGHPQAVQGTVRFWWAAKYLGFGDKTSFSEEEIKLINDEEEKFILLLQLNMGDSNIEIDYFGDCIVYFGIHKDDLQNMNFEKAVLVMQST